MSTAKVETGRVALSTATAGNTQDFTITGFGTPAAAIFFITAGTTDDTIATTTKFGGGFTDGTNNLAACINCGGTTTSITSRCHITNGCITSVNTSDAEDGRFSFNSWITDGVRLDIDDAMPSAFLCTYVLFADADVANAFAGFLDDLGTGTAPVNIDFSDAGGTDFEPDLVFVMNIGLNTAPSVAASQSLMSFGVGINDVGETQRVGMIGVNDAQGTSQVTSWIGNDAITGQSISSSTQWRAAIESYDANGFSLDPTASAGSDVVFYLALKFTDPSDLALFDMTWPTTGDYAETGPGFEPAFGLLFASQGASSRNATVTSANGSFSIATFDANGIYTNTITAEDNVGTHNHASLASDQMRILDDDGSSNRLVATFDGFDADGWDFSVTTNPAASLLGWGLAIGAPTSTALVAEAGAFTITGTDANLEVGYLVDAESVTVTITGTDANLEVGYLVDAEAGAFTITGTDANLEVGYLVNGEAGAFTITGADADLVVSGADPSLVAEAGAFTITGTDANLEVGYLVDAESVTVTITGTDANLEVGYLVDAEAGAFTITGTDADLVVSGDVVLDAEAGAFTITGTDATLTYSGAPLYVKITSRQSIARELSSSQSIASTITSRQSITQTITHRETIR